MNLTLGDLLTESQMNQAQEALEVIMEALDNERDQELTRVHRLFAERGRLAKREAILKVLADIQEHGVGEIPAPTPKITEDTPEITEYAPKTAEPLARCYTASEIAAKLGVHKDTVAYYKKAGLLPEPLPGSGGKPSNPYLYEIPDWAGFKRLVNERRNSAIGAAAKAQIQQLQAAKGEDGATRYTSRELAEAMGAHPSSVSNWVRAGWVTPLNLPETRGFIFEVPDIEALKVEFEDRRQAAKQANGVKLQATRPQPNISEPVPSPKSIEVSGAEIEVSGVEIESTGGAPEVILVGLEKASRHPYHWSHALPLVEAAIEQAEGEPFEVAYQRGASSFVVRPLGGVSADLDPFVRVVFEARQWEIIPSLRTGWLAPQAQALRAAWQRAHAGSVTEQSGVSTMRSLRA